VELASSDGARGLVLANTFTSLPAAAQKQLPWLPMGLILSTRMNSLAKIENYRGPILVSHGDADGCPFAQGQALFEAAPGPKRLVTCRGCKHNDPPPKNTTPPWPLTYRNYPPWSVTIRTASLNVQ
jgi:fermentation-respiration switch protein FrsA (DUF1100 family)